MLCFFVLFEAKSSITAIPTKLAGLYMLHFLTCAKLEKGESKVKALIDDDCN